jgi:imidazolonepropionase-like amidohydrolase
MSDARLPVVPEGTGSYRLVGATLIDGTGADRIADAEVAVDGGRIAYAGPRRGGEFPGDLVELGGATVLPGFIDAHVHFGLNFERDRAVEDAEFESESVLRAANNLEATLDAGITTARDLGGIDAGFRSAIAGGRIRGPRLHLAVAVLSPTGGHADPFLPNGRRGPLRLASPIDPLVDTDDEVRRAVRLLVRAGADVIKVCTSGGVSSPSDTPDDLGIPEHQVRLIVEETARRQGQPVAAHAQGAAGILEAVRGGVASVEHGYGIDEAGIELMLDRGTFLVPTLSTALRLPDPAKVPPYLYEKKVRWSAIARDRVAAAFAAGVRVALGTDAAVCPHGSNLTELVRMVELGLSPMAAIVAGTSAAAELLRLSDDLGTVTAGKVADLVITSSDPLRDIAALAGPAGIGAVIQGGRVVTDRMGLRPPIEP